MTTPHPPDLAFEAHVLSMFEERFVSGAAFFFVQGLWRSGTSWLGRMLGSHPEVYVCHQELQTYMRECSVTAFGTELSLTPFLKGRYDTSRKVAFLSLLLHLQSRTKPRARLIGERSPGGDVAELKRAFPAAKLIIILRDGRDIATSVAHRAGQRGDAPLDERKQIELSWVDAAARRYASYVTDYFAVKLAHPDDTHW